MTVNKPFYFKVYATAAQKKKVPLLSPHDDIPSKLDHG